MPPVLGPMVIMFHRHRFVPRAVLYDANLDLRSIEELRAWARRDIEFVVLDSETGEDVTRVLLSSPNAPQLSGEDAP